VKIAKIKKLPFSFFFQSMKRNDKQIKQSYHKLPKKKHDIYEKSLNKEQSGLLAANQDLHGLSMKPVNI
jgi:hypothetical protein